MRLSLPASAGLPVVDDSNLGASAFCPAWKLMDSDLLQDCVLASATALLREVINV
jgi:hypothetical protein